MKHFFCRLPRQAISVLSNAIPRSLVESNAKDDRRIEQFTLLLNSCRITFRTIDDDLFARGAEIISNFWTALDRAHRDGIFPAHRTLQIPKSDSHPHMRFEASEDDGVTLELAESVSIRMTHQELNAISEWHKAYWCSLQQPIDPKPLEGI
jgi:hypothetical protein